MIEFQAFPKIPRYRREIAVSEKIDGSNAAVVWVPQTVMSMTEDNGDVLGTRILIDQHGTDLGAHHLLAQSRQRFITPTHIKPKNDNYGFAQWVYDHIDDLTKLGPGYHYGEWWGYGIQRGYGMPEKHFSLFNVSRWGEGKQERPACCDVVPLIGYFLPDQISVQVELLRAEGSRAAPGYMKPEGVVLWHSQSKSYFKILLDGDDIPKGLWKAAEQV